jgi:hypothetical protein
MPIPVTDLISTTAPSDTYATHDASLGKGGHRTVDTHQDLLDISPERRSPGMQVHVKDTDRLYKLNNSLKAWTYINQSITILDTEAELPSAPQLAGSFAYTKDSKKVFTLGNDLLTWTEYNTSLSDALVTNVMLQIDLNTIPLEDRYIGMLAKLSNNSYYKLTSINYDANNVFEPNISDWTLINQTNLVELYTDEEEIEALSANEIYTSRFLISEANTSLLQLTESEWTELQPSDAAYLIVSTISDLTSVPPYYRKPGVIVFVESESKLYTRNNTNNGWITITGEPGRGIANVSINPVTGELEVEYTDGTIESVGVVRGEQGEQGVSVVNVDLYENPANPGDVYFITELSNGVVLQTSRSISGYNGASVADVYVENDQFYFTLSDGTILPPVLVSGITPVSVERVYIDGPDFKVDYTNGTTDVIALASEVQGRGILSADLVDGQLQLEWSDAPGVVETIGTLQGLLNIAVIDGELFVEYNTNPGTNVKIGDVNSLIELSRIDGELFAEYTNNPGVPVSLGALISITGAYVNGSAELIFTTDALAPANEINVGVVANLKGADGQSLASVELINNELIFTLADGTPLDPIPVSGLTPISVVSARIEDGELYFGLSDGSEINAGIAGDLEGRGIVDAEVNATGQVLFTYTDSPTQIEAGVLSFPNSIAVTNGEVFVTFSDDNTPQSIGLVPGIDNMVVVDGDIIVYYTNDPLTPVVVGSINTIETFELINSVLRVNYENGNFEDIGTIKYILSMQINVDDELEVEYSDAPGVFVSLGNVKGDQGLQGWSIINAVVDPSGDLILTTDNPNVDENVINAGFVRNTVNNFIGQTYSYTADPGQTDFLVNHNGDVLVFISGVLIDESEYNIGALDRIVLNTPLTGGEDVRIVVYAAGGPSETGRGIVSITDSNGRYTVTLEDSSTFIIDTSNPQIDPEILPPGIAENGITVLPNGDIQVTLTDGSVFIAGSANNAISVVSAYIDVDGNLIIVTDDPENPEINAGNVLNNLAVQSIVINEDGDLIITMNDGSNPFNAGPISKYVIGASIDGDGILSLQMSSGPDIEAGSVRNPLLGMVYDFIAFEGQTEFDLEHNGYETVVYANGVALSKSSIILTNPTKVVLDEARSSNDIIKIMLMYSETVTATELSGASSAPNNTYYGKNEAGATGFYPVNNIKVAVPYDFTATAGQTVFFVSHNNAVEVIVNGVFLMNNQYTLPNATRVTLNTPLTGGERVRINALSSPVNSNGFIASNYSRFKFLTNTHGGTATVGVWLPRSLNTIEANSIGAILDKNTMILSPGIYYVRGWAAANAVGASAIRLYNVSNGSILLTGDSIYTGTYNRSATTSPLDVQFSNMNVPVEGYFELTTQSAIQVQHRVTYTRNTYGFGVVGGGFPGTTAATSGNPPSSTTPSQSTLGIPATLVDMQVWKVG